MSSILDVLFSSAARIEVLRLFLHTPDRHFFQREIGRETGQPIRAVQREVDRLTGIGLLVRAEEGNRVFYYVDPQFPLLAELTALFQEAGGATPGHPELVRVVGPAHVRYSPEPSSVKQPFAWMETPAAPALPPELKRMQSEGEWDQAY